MLRVEVELWVAFSLACGGELLLVVGGKRVLGLDDCLVSSVYFWERCDRSLMGGLYDLGFEAGGLF